jgi:hypothetical protein
MIWPSIGDLKGAGQGSGKVDSAVAQLVFI